MEEGKIGLKLKGNLTLKSGLANPMADIPPMLQFIKQKRIKIDLVTALVADWDTADKALLQKTTEVMLQRNPIKNSG